MGVQVDINLHVQVLIRIDQGMLDPVDSRLLFVARLNVVSIQVPWESVEPVVAAIYSIWI